MPDLAEMTRSAMDVASDVLDNAADANPAKAAKDREPEGTGGCRHRTRRTARRSGADRQASRSEGLGPWGADEGEAFGHGLGRGEGRRAVEA